MEDIQQVFTGRLIKCAKVPIIPLLVRVHTGDAQPHTVATWHQETPEPMGAPAVMASLWTCRLSKES